MYMACNISHITTPHERVLIDAIVDALQSLKCSNWSLKDGNWIWGVFEIK